MRISVERIVQIGGDVFDLRIRIQSCARMIQIAIVWRIHKVKETTKVYE